MKQLGSYIRSSLAVLLSLNIIACGDSAIIENSASDNSVSVNTQESNADTTSLKTLRFVDSAVEGLTVVSGDNNEIVHLTNSNGEAFYSGNSVRFYIGDKDSGQPLGDLIIVPEDGVVTPQEIVEASSPFDDSVLNLVSWLMGLDDDNNPENGIKLNKAVRDQSNQTEIDFEQSLEEFRSDANVINRFANLSQVTSSGNALLPDSEVARAHFRNTLEQLNRIEISHEEDNSSQAPDTDDSDSPVDEERDLLEDKLNQGELEESAVEDSSDQVSTDEENNDTGTGEEYSSDGGDNDSASEDNGAESGNQNENGESNDSSAATGGSGDSLVSLAKVIANSDTCGPLGNVSILRRGLAGLDEGDSNWVSDAGGFLAYNLLDGEQNWYVYTPATRRVRRVSHISDLPGDYPVVCQAHFES